jgi:hypothetical protein
LYNGKKKRWVTKKLRKISEYNSGRGQKKKKKKLMPEWS